MQKKRRLLSFLLIGIQIALAAPVKAATPGFLLPFLWLLLTLETGNSHKINSGESFVTVIPRPNGIVDAENDPEYQRARFEGFFKIPQEFTCDLSAPALNMNQCTLKSLIKFVPLSKMKPKLKRRLLAKLKRHVEGIKKGTDEEGGEKDAVSAMLITPSYTMLLYRTAPYTFAFPDYFELPSDRDNAYILTGYVADSGDWYALNVQPALRSNFGPQFLRQFHANSEEATFPPVHGDPSIVLRRFLFGGPLLKARGEKWCRRIFTQTER